MLLETLKKVRLHNGGDAIAVAEFNNGYSHVVVDDHCWVVVNGGYPSAHLYREAMAVLKQLPDHPNDYGPYREYTSVPVHAGK